jgi:prophage regulatory protein
MRSARKGPKMPAEEAASTPGDVLIDLGTALVAFGTSLQLAGTRLQANQLPPAVAQAAAAAPTAAVTSRLPAEGCVRIWDIIGRRAAKGRPAITGMIPVSSATWYAGVKTGRFPKPIKTGGIALWRVEDIRALVAQLGR